MSFPFLSLPSILSPHFSYLPLPLPLEVGPYIAARGSGGPAPQKQFWHIWSPGKASGGKDLVSSCYSSFECCGLKVGQKARPGPKDATPLKCGKIMKAINNENDAVFIIIVFIVEGHRSGKR